MSREPAQVRDIFVSVIAFVTLFLGLVAGWKPVGVMVASPVSSVEILFDGKSAGVLKKAPWTLDCNFGTALTPHELVAVARNAKGEELGRAVQLLNVPRETAEATIVLENDRTGRPVAARIAGQSLRHSKPSKVTVRLDDKPLAFSELGRMPLPSYDLEKVHFLSVDLEFSAMESTKVGVAFGGGLGSDVTSEMTAVPLIVAKRSALPPADRLTGWFVAEGESLKVAAVETGPAQVILVRGGGSEPYLASLGPSAAEYRRMQSNPMSASRSADPDAFRFSQSLGDDDRLRFLFPAGSPTSDTELPAYLFPATRDYSKKDGGFIFLLINIASPITPASPPQHLADAVAVSALQAASANLRRAVVLLVGKEPRDASQYSVPAVKAYLEAIRVPLYVWCISEPDLESTRAEWGRGEDVSTPARFDAAVVRLKNDLEQQRIVWFEGRVLPQRVALAQSRPNVRLAP